MLTPETIIFKFNFSILTTKCLKRVDTFTLVLVPSHGVFMAINQWCPVCKTTCEIGTELCKCGNNLRVNRKFRVRFRLPDGHWKSKIVDSHAMARNVESKFKVESVEQDVFDVHRAPRISDVWKQYIKWAEVNKRSWKDDRSLWEIHIKQHLGTQFMDRITPSRIEAVLNDMKERKSPKGEPYAPASIKHVLVLVKRLYNWTIKRDLYHGPNPAEKVEVQRFDNQVTNPLKRKDVERLLSYIDTWDNERAAMVIRFALFSGRRRGEILHLKWKNVNLETGYVTFPGMHTKNKRTQAVPLNQNCMVIIKRCEEMKIGEWVFPSSTGAFYTTFKNTWKGLQKKLDLDYRFHDLRHTFASYLASSGQVDLLILKELLGHRETKMTQRYAHLINGALRRGADVADEVFK
ncbi:MAG: site-specific integrase [Desulfobacteraceae bacterium]|jgi:integrase